MPIINIQRKLTEVGRIRLGAKSDKGAPQKLDKFRLTSKSKEALDAAAEVYGGVVKPWAGPDGDSFELLTTTNVLDVVVPPGNGPPAAVPASALRGANPKKNAGSTGKNSVVIKL